MRALSSLFFRFSKKQDFTNVLRYEVRVVKIKVNIIFFIEPLVKWAFNSTVYV